MKLVAAPIVLFALVLISSLGVPAIQGSVVQDKPPSPEAMQYMREGSQYFMLKNFKIAIAAYSKALELEKKDPSLGKPLWYALVDNLSIAYGLIGDIKKARETIKYGLTRDAKYPMFYYNLACAYAEVNDLDNAITQLKRAFELREHVLPAQTMPDPAKDESFRRFMKNNRFLAVLEELKKGGR